ncbi:DoxX family protein [Paenibacillus sp. BSR1-1]|uniref:DoxX family protein n=1 Tax=Paenibacillus sp. BSR1-1 TaxID=3020845 RepID=UPI0025AF9A69|nr:DoxX family protein [Paenibacillus sp. BSR1-1]MDN3016241.1 DoxX family protein [Paenibacillus sp. BSR1-1]
MFLKNEVGALILRVTLGAIFLIHGIVKFQGGIENIVGWFSSIGLPGFMAYAVALIEIIGGIALIIGLGTRIVSALFSILMIGAILKVKLSVGFLGNGQMAGYELDLGFLAIAVFLVISGSKLISIDQFFSKKDSNEIKKAA